MNAIQLKGLEGFKSLRLVDVERPTPAANEVLVDVKAAGINSFPTAEDHAVFQALASRKTIGKAVLIP